MQARQNPLQAAGFILLASALFGGVTLLAKLAGGNRLGDPLSPFQVGHARFLFAFLAIAVTSLVMRLRLQSPNLGLHFLRSLSGWAGVTLMFTAVTYIPLSDATAISFLNPVFAMVLAIFILGEKVGRWRWLAAGIAFVGGLIVIRPDPANFQPAALIALGAAVVMGLEVTIIKLLSGRERPLQILFVNNAMGLMIASVAVVFVWQSPSLAQWLALAGLGLIMAVGQACFIQAMRRAEASFVVPFSYTTLIFAALFDYVGFREIPSAMTFIGAGVIITGALLLAWREARTRNNQ